MPGGCRTASLSPQCGDLRHPRLRRRSRTQRGEADPRTSSPQTFPCRAARKHVDGKEQERHARRRQLAAVLNRNARRNGVGGCRNVAAGRHDGTLPSSQSTVQAIKKRWRSKTSRARRTQSLIRKGSATSWPRAPVAVATSALLMATEGAREEVEAWESGPSRASVMAISTAYRSLGVRGSSLEGVNSGVTNACGTATGLEKRQRGWVLGG